jgi:serine/threonine-protein kinase
MPRAGAYPEAMSAPEPGTLLAGKYMVERVLGVGGMGVVVAARHIQLDQKVAIKYLLPDALANAEVVERFAREAQAAAKIRGEHVARIIDVGKFDDGAPFMVLEYLEGQNLEELLEQRGPLPYTEAVGYMLETCEALAEAHAAGIVHRDLKPANLFLALQPDRRSIVKVLDFGISKLADASGHGITKTSTVMGTPYYMSPEQLVASKAVDARSDIWSLGVILHELLTNRRPFDGETLAEIVGGILQNQPDRIASLRNDVPLDLELCISKCLASKPDQRHASVGAFAVALAPFAPPEQRSSVEKIARVLGASLAPPGLASEALPAAPARTGPAFDATAIVGSERFLPDAATAHSFSKAAPEPAAQPRPSVSKFALGGAVVVLAGGAFFALRGRGATPAMPQPPQQIAIAVSAPVEVAPKPKDVQTTHVIASAAATEPSASASPPSVVATRPTAKHTDVRAPVRPTAPVASVAAPAAATAKNPLEMGIK